MVIAEAREVIKVPEGVTVTVRQEPKGLTVTGPKGELSMAVPVPRVSLSKEDGRIVVSCSMARRKEKAVVGTFASHIRNMVRGVQQEYEYRLKIVYSHFPIKTKVQGETFLVDNFIGEKAARKATIMPGVKVKVEGDTVLVSSIDVVKAGQTAANIEQACRIRYRDPRVFQDGIYITQKPE